MELAQNIKVKTNVELLIIAIVYDHRLQVTSPMSVLCVTINKVQ